MMLKLTCCVSYDYDMEFIILALVKSDYGRFLGDLAPIRVLNGLNLLLIQVLELF